MSVSYSSPATAAEAICAALASDLARLVEHDPLVRGGDIEAVHQARVATRRFRSQLRTFGHVMKKGRATRVSKDLRRFAALLGAVRDLDVMRQRIVGASSTPTGATVAPLGSDATAQQLAESAGGTTLIPSIPPAVISAVGARFDSEREKAFRKLVSAMNSPSYERLLESLASFVAAPPFRPTAAGRPAVEVLEPAAERAWQRLEREVDSLPGVPTDSQLHGVRIAAKRARYACQVTTPRNHEACDRLARRLARLQDVLGELNDASRAVVWLAKLRVESAEQSGDLPLETAGLTLVASEPSIPFFAGIDLLIARERVRMAAARTNWPTSWSKALEAAIDLGWSAGPGVPATGEPQAATSGG